MNLYAHSKHIISCSPAIKECFQKKGFGFGAEKAALEYAKEIALYGVLNNEANIEKKPIGDSIDIAFLVLGKKLNINKDKIKILETIPYESENKYSAVFYEKDGETYCTVKGSLEKIMSFSEKNEKYEKQNIDLTSKGYRVIAIADGKVKGTSEKDIKKLDFIGMVAFIDPIRVEVKDSLKECSEAGIKVVMITGDHVTTAKAIALQLGILHEGELAITSAELAKISDEELLRDIEKYRVYARVSPNDKVRIVSTWKEKGYFK